MRAHTAAMQGDVIDGQVTSTGTTHSDLELFLRPASGPGPCHHPLGPVVEDSKDDVFGTSYGSGCSWQSDSTFGDASDGAKWSASGAGDSEDSESVTSTAGHSSRALGLRSRTRGKRKSKREKERPSLDSQTMQLALTDIDTDRGAGEAVFPLPRPVVSTSTLSGEGRMRKSQSMGSMPSRSPHAMPHGTPPRSGGSQPSKATDCPSSRSRPLHFQHSPSLPVSTSAVTSSGSDGLAPTQHTLGYGSHMMRPRGADPMRDLPAQSIAASRPAACVHPPAPSLKSQSADRLFNGSAAHLAVVGEPRRHLSWADIPGDECLSSEDEDFNVKS
eukprot:Opistho-2@59845